MTFHQKIHPSENIEAWNTIPRMLKSCAKKCWVDWYAAIVANIHVLHILNREVFNKLLLHNMTLMKYVCGKMIFQGYPDLLTYWMMYWLFSAVCDLQPVAIGFAARKTVPRRERAVPPPTTTLVPIRILFHLKLTWRYFFQFCNRNRWRMQKMVVVQPAHTHVGRPISSLSSFHPCNFNCTIFLQSSLSHFIFQIIHLCCVQILQIKVFQI